MLFLQRTLTLPAFSNGIFSNRMRMITREIVETMPEIRELDCGMLNIFLQHTSASITINENADPDVQQDIQMALGKIIPDALPYKHTLEGQDDMPAHIKSSMVGVSVNIPIGRGRLLLGTWQGIYLCEHRRTAHRRSIVLTVWGKKRNNIE
ncbi:MAG: secondary thiamine-phosphate synthase enzyme YjbQ [Planctomycetaceae bacterium]|jgi:secondary thiamine-phosphate synthase enzyme|nr:secondary thiamine-phosphate synthase enzyme YjbQ [Planctomycetaceae bacterium]